MDRYRDVLNINCEPEKSKWLPKGKWKKCPIRVIQTAMRAQLSDSPWVHLCVYPTGTALFFPLYKHFASLLSVFVEILFCKAIGPCSLSLTTGLVARIWCFHCHDPADSGWEPKAHSKLLQAEATQDQGCVIWFEDLFISLLMFLLLHSSYSCLKATIPVSGNLQISCFKAIVETWNVPCSHNFLFKVHAPNWCVSLSCNPSQHVFLNPYPN